MTQCKLIATINGRSKQLGPWNYNDETKFNIDRVLEAVKLGKTSYQKGVPAPDAKLVFDDTIR